MEENRDTRRGKTRCWPMVYISWSLLWSSDAMSGCCVVVEKWVDDQAVARLGQGSSPEEDDDDDDVDVGFGRWQPSSRTQLSMSDKSISVDQAVIRDLL